MKTATFWAICVWTAQAVAAQGIILERYVFGAAGTSRTSNDIYISATAGQAVVGTRTSGGAVFTQGFHQQWLETPVARAQLIAHDIFLFPNPTDGVFVLSGLEPGTDVRITAYDLVGKRIEVRRDGLRFEFPENAAAGVYPVRLTLIRPDGATDYVNFKIQLYR